jgi:hypothetical protein
VKRSREPRKVYKPAATYTAEQLRDAEIADQEADVRCAERDGQPEYAEECRKKIATLTNGRRYMVVRVNDKTGERIDMMLTTATHAEACTIKRKLIPDAELPDHLRNAIEERA